MADETLLGFEGVERVVADPLRFKLKLRIGEEAYTSLKLRKNLVSTWDVGSFAATGAGLAASPIVATTFFPATGALAWLGLGAAAATPIGWIVTAALASGGAYYGIVSLVRKFTGSRVDTIPKFINTPLDLLGASLFDLMGGLATRLAVIDGRIAEEERAAIRAHFMDEWGFDGAYSDRALDILFDKAAETRVKNIAAAIAEFQASCPDCNAGAMAAELLQFLRELAEADGEIDEREELALDAIRSILTSGNASALTKLGKSASRATGATKDALSAVLGKPRLRRAP